jgi:hypothetical protein
MPGSLLDRISGLLGINMILVNLVEGFLNFTEKQ